MVKGVCSIKFLAFYDLIKSWKVCEEGKVTGLSYAGNRERELLASLTVFL